MAVEYQTIDPRAWKLHPKIVDPRAVEFYRRHPDRGYGGGRQTEMPSLDRLDSGRYKVMQGNHRIAAAIAEGRTIHVEIRSADGPKGSEKSRGFWAWLCS